MKHLDFKFYFGFDDDYTAENEACYISVSDSLFNKLKGVYKDSFEVNLQNILDNEELTANQEKELAKLIETLKEDLISVQHDNGDDYDPYTGEEYDFSQLIIDIEVVPPEDWDEE